MRFLTLTSLPWHLVQLCVYEHVGVWLTVSFIDPRNASEKCIGSGVVEKQTHSFLSLSQGNALIAPSSTLYFDSELKKFV